MFTLQLQKSIFQIYQLFFFILTDQLNFFPMKYLVPTTHVSGLPQLRPYVSDTAVQVNALCTGDFIIGMMTHCLPPILWSTAHTIMNTNNSSLYS